MIFIKTIEYSLKEKNNYNLIKYDKLIYIIDTYHKLCAKWQNLTSNKTSSNPKLYLKKNCFKEFSQFRISACLLAGKLEITVFDFNDKS